jgi:hypothetical protein
MEVNKQIRPHPLSADFACEAVNITCNFAIQPFPRDADVLHRKFVALFDKALSEANGGVKEG